MATFDISGTDIAYYHWEPEGNARAVLTLIHGHGEYAGRYEHVAKALNRVGVGVWAIDFFGHGHSGGKKGHIKSYEAGLDLIGAALKHSAAAYAGEPQFLFGHSMGGNFVANYVLQRKPELAGVILSSPWLRLAFEPNSFQKLLAKVGGVVMPALTQPSKLDAKGISSLPAEVDRYIQDPLIHDMISATLYNGIVTQGEWALTQAAEWSLPLYLYHGDADPITSHAASKDFADQVPAEYASFTSWPGSFHETHHDKDQDQVIESLVQWVLGKSST